MATDSPAPPPAPAQARPKRLRTLRGTALRWTLASAIGLLALVAVLVALASYALRTEAGNAWLLARVPGLTVSAPRGVFSGGPYAATRVEYAAADGLRVVVDGLGWQDLRWRFRPREGSLLGITLVAPRAERIEVRTAPATAPSSPSGAPRSLRLPVEVEVQDLSVATLVIDDQPALTGLAASLHLGEDNGRVHRLSGARVTRDGLQLSADARIDTQAPLALQAQAALRALPDAALPWEADVQAQGPLERLELQAALRSVAAAAPAPAPAPASAPAPAPAGSIDVQATVTAFAAWPLAALSADVKAFDLAPLGAGLPATRLDGRVTVDSVGADQPAQIDIALSNSLPGRWDDARLPMQALNLTLRGTPSDRRQLDFTRLDVRLPGAGRIEGSGRWQADTLALDLRLAGVQPMQLDGRAAAMTVGGPLSLTLQGLPSPDGSRPAAEAPLRATLRGDLDGRLAQRTAPRTRITLQAEAERQPDGQLLAEVQQLRATAGGARAQLTARWQAAADGAWTLRSAGEFAAFDPTPWLPGPEGSAWRRGPHRFDGSWKADLSAPATVAGPAGAASTPAAPWAAWRGTAVADLRDSQLAGVPLTGHVEWKGDGGHRLAGWLDAAGNRIEVDGLTGGRPAADRWQATLAAPALAALAPLGALHPALQAWVPRSGTAAGQASVQGRWPALRTEGTLQVQALQTGNLRMQRVAANWQGSADADAPLALDLAADGLAHGEQRIDSLRARVDGSLRRHGFTLDASSPVRPPAWTDLAEARRAAAAAPAAGGTVLKLRGEGQWEPGTRWWRGRIAELLANDRAQPQPAWLSARDLQAGLRFDADGGVAEAAAQPGRIDLLGAALRWQTARWQAAGPNAEPMRVDVDAELEPLRIAPWLARFRPEMRWGGDLALQGRLQLHTAGAMSADVVIERSGGDLTLTDEAGTEALGLSDLRLSVAAQDGTWYFTQAVAGTNLGVLTGAQTLRTPPQALWPAPQTPLQGVLEWRVENLAVWAPWVPPAWRLAGQLRTSAYFNGTFGEPGINGELVGSGLAVRNLLQGIDARNGELSIQLRGTEATIQRFSIQGGDGRATLTGGATLGAKPSARLRLEAQRFMALGRLDRRIVTSGQADLAFEGDRLKLDGRFMVDEGLIDFSRGDAPSLDADVVVVRRRGDPPITPDQAAAAARAAEAADAPALNADVRIEVSLGEQLKLRGRGIDTKLRGRVAVTTPGGKLAVNGAVRTESGTYAAYGQKLEIERGIVRFDGPVENPRLEIVAIRPNLDVQVGVQIGGTAVNPRVRLFSDPDMADMDKLSWLLLGRAPDGLARNDTALLQRAAMALLAGDGPSRTGDLMKSIGLDDISVRQDENGTTRDTVVSLGKQISQRVYLGYEHGVNTAAGNWQLIYRAAQRFTLRAQAGADPAVDIIWTWRWN
ncbi:translocation/assembly module TamB domain-containing protein [Aquincola sp. MAHUQ-54]|uniref:Translocation/assembly module TamB domain-containing protein n=1 Tax=Aquincola agrisoli TaxID=3119538 RepID=A0AAW9Q298_9BURK